eukprot:3932639-Rhodomonas_salina.1
MGSNPYDVVPGYRVPGTKRTFQKPFLCWLWFPAKKFVASIRCENQSFRGTQTFCGPHHHLRVHASWSQWRGAEQREEGGCAEWGRRLLGAGTRGEEGRQQAVTEVCAAAAVAAAEDERRVRGERSRARHASASGKDCLWTERAAALSSRNFRM